MPSFFKQKNASHSNEKPNDQQQCELTSTLLSNLKCIQEKTGNSSDIVTQRFEFGPVKREAALVYVEGIVKSQSIHQFFSDLLKREHSEREKEQSDLEFIREFAAVLGRVTTVYTWKDAFRALMSGSALFLVDGFSEIITASAKGGEKRAIEEPTTQQSVRGQRSGFTESIRTNTALVRRLIKNPDLWVESLQIGNVTKTDVSIMYINGLAKEKIVEEVRKRLKKIDIDSILESGYIEQLIEDETITTFPTIYHTERPDIVAGNLLEGRIAIFVDGTPFVLLAPAVFIQFFQAVEDYYSRFDIATALRFLRVLIFLISLVAPAIFIAGVTFHQEMIPTSLLITIAAQREAVPFPAFVEALIMEIAFEILREAGIRLPRTIGSAVSIVGAVVIGQAAVQAGIVSPAMVIIVAFTAIASFATPSFAIAISVRLLRFILMVLSAMFGMYGIILGLIVIIVHLCSLRSFGVPYMSPLAPLVPGNAGDTIVRMPWWSLRQRPRLMGSRNTTRQGSRKRPLPPASRNMTSDQGKNGDQNEG
ncbi:spore germination protein [Metabacillus sp. RGM 3146]|uniref:spore germination protein n=1 Tax=Metabacillus sp. RGM 3146 TaxID=3401092 RepID=UPI003B9A1AFA